MAKLNVKDSQFLVGGNPVAQVRDGSVDLGEVSMVDVTTTTDTTNAQVAGIRESMEGTVTLVWDPAETTHASLLTAYLAGTLLTGLGFRVRDNTPTNIVSYTGSGFILNISAPIATQGGNSAMECTVRFKLSGKYTKA
jgi:hypothetical protein